MSTTSIYWAPSGVYPHNMVSTYLIERRARWLPLEPPFQSGGVYKFDYIHAEGMDFAGAFARTWGNSLRVNLFLTEEKSSRYKSVWEVVVAGNLEKQWQRVEQSVQHSDARIIRHSFDFDVSAFKADDPFAIIVWRMPEKTGDTLDCEALLTGVEAVGEDP